MISASPIIAAGTTTSVAMRKRMRRRLEMGPVPEPPLVRLVFLLVEEPGTTDCDDGGRTFLRRLPMRLLQHIGLANGSKILHLDEAIQGEDGISNAFKRIYSGKAEV